MSSEAKVALFIILGLLLIAMHIVAGVFVIIFTTRKLRKRHRFTNITGDRGERYISRLLNSLGGVVFNNYIILDKNRHSHQIDHIYVGQTGVFVIETKNYSGYIWGTEHAREWIQKLDYGRVENKFYNPVKQNLTHLYQIKEIMPKDIPVFSRIVFVQGNTEHIEAPNVCTPSGLQAVILNSPIVLSDEKINEAVDILNANRSTEVSLEDHINSVNQMREDVENGICPRCKGKLVLREGKYGKFYGCSNYPHCKFTKQIDE